MSASAFFSLVLSFLFLDYNHSDVYVYEAEANFFARFLFGWFVDGDGRGVVGSSLYMIRIRAQNAIKILMYVFILLVWCVASLANKKTGCCAMITSFLIGAGIAISEMFGLGGLHDLNFQLVLALMILVGWWTGGHVHKITGVMEMDFPKLNFLEHLPA